MVEVDVMQEKIEHVKIGRAYTYSAELLPVFAEEVKKFLKDAPDSLKHDPKWPGIVTTTLLKYERNDAGDITGSSLLMNAFLSQRVLNDLTHGRNLITGRQLLKLWEQSGKKNPFGAVYIDTGVAVRTENDSVYPSNDLIAKTLVQGLEARAIEIGRGLVPDFYMLDVDYSQASGYGLVLRLNDLTEKQNVASVSEFPWKWGRDDGVARACLGGHDWESFDRYLGDPDADGRVVGYDAEGVAKNF